MSSEIGEMPEPRQETPERAPGGADANPYAESDVGATEPDGDVVTPDPPLSAQQDEADVPDALSEPQPDEPEEQETDNTEGMAPSG